MTTEPRPDQVRGELADGLSRYLSGKAMHDDGRVWLDISFPELMILREALRTPGVDDCGAAREALIKLNQLLDRYWEGNNSKSDVIAICEAQQECKAALSQPNPGDT